MARDVFVLQCLTFVSFNYFIFNFCIMQNSVAFRAIAKRSFCNRSAARHASEEGHKKSYFVTATGKGSIVSTTTDTGHFLSSDVPKKMGGSNLHPQPLEHFLSALTGCEHVTAVYVGRSMMPRILIDRIDFEISAVRDERGALQHPINTTPPIPSRLQQISGVVKVFTKGGRLLSEDELHMLKHQTEARCPVANMIIASGCEMQVEWIDGNSGE